MPGNSSRMPYAPQGVKGFDDDDDDDDEGRNTTTKLMNLTYCQTLPTDNIPVGSLQKDGS